MSSSGIQHELTGRVLTVVGDPVRRRLARWLRLLPQINALEEELLRLDGRELRKHADGISRSKHSLVHNQGSPHRFSNSANFLSISSPVRIFFSVKIFSMLTIQRA